MSSTLGTISFFSPTSSRQSDATVEWLVFVHSAEHLAVALRYTALDSGLVANHLSTSLFAIILSVWAAHLWWGGSTHSPAWASLSSAVSTQYTVKVCKRYFPFAVLLFLLLLLLLLLLIFRLHILILLEALHIVTPVISYTCSNFVVSKAIFLENVLDLSGNLIKCMATPESFGGYCRLPPFQSFTINPVSRPEVASVICTPNISGGGHVVLFFNGPFRFLCHDSIYVLSKSFAKVFLLGSTC